MDQGLKGWLPKGLQQVEGESLCRWTFVGDTRFEAPFFEETLQQCLNLPENASRYAVLSQLDLLTDAAVEVEALEPAAFIFHVSRCGSTLVTQLLNEDPAFLTLSAVPFFDALLRARFRPGLKASSALLEAALKLHGQRRNPEERHLVVKLDSWHAAFHGKLRALYPDTPFILLYREPGAVIRSQRRRAGQHAVPGLLEPALFGPGVEEAAALPWQEYLPRVLQSYYEAFLRIARADARSLLLPYGPDMTGPVEAIARFAGLPLGPDHLERMRIRARHHAKDPLQPFVEADGAPIEVPAPCQAAYEALERQRSGSAT